MGELSNKVLEKIKEKKIEPKPRWQFLLKKYFIWTSFVLSVLIGAIASCIIADVFFDNDWDIYKYAADNPLQKIIISIPFIWFGVLVLFLALAYFNYKHMKSGYKYEAYAILGLSIITSVVLGLFLNFYFGAGEKVDALLVEHVPFYIKISSHCNNKEVWMQPEKGLLAGRIVRIARPDNFDLEDFNGLLWTVKESRNIFMHANSPLVEREEVKIIGEKEADGLFRALEIRQWRKGCMTSEDKEDKD